LKGLHLCLERLHRVTIETSGQSRCAAVDMWSPVLRSHCDLFSTQSFREAILCAVNLDDDAGTTTAVCGRIAGVHYGVEGIPRSWLANLVERVHWEYSDTALRGAEASP
jgi:ADP-ribosylglycohydrolase